MSKKTKTTKRKPANAPLEPPRPLPNEPEARVSAVTFSLVDRWANHPGQGLTTRSIVRIFEEAERGFPAEQCDLFEDLLERDAHLRSQVEGRIEAVSGKGWIVQAGGDRPSDVRAATQLEEAMRAVPNFAEMLVHQLTANFYGFAATEIVWEHRDGLTVPVWFVNAPHRRFLFNDRDEPRLITDTKNLAAGAELEPGKWIFSRRAARQTTRSGLMRTAAWWSLFKHMSVRDWMIFSARFGLPYATGKYKTNATPEDKKVLKTAVLSLGRDGAAIMSENTEIEILEITRQGGAADVHGALTELCNREISKLVSGATLTSESGGPGSFALGRVHADRSFDLTMGDAERLAQRFEVDVGAPFVHFNGLPGRPPRLKIHVIREMDPKTRAEVMAKLANEVGLELDEDQVRQEFQLKKPSGTALKGTAKPAPSAPPTDAPPPPDVPATE